MSYPLKFAATVTALLGFGQMLPGATDNIPVAVAPVASTAPVNAKQAQFDAAIGLLRSGDPEEALRALFQLGDGGFAPAAYALGGIYSSGELALAPRNFDTSMKWFRKAVDSDDSPKGAIRIQAQMSIGLLVYSGYGSVKGDPVEAMRWYRLAAAGGLAAAQNAIGWLYRDGAGVAKDDHDA